MTKHKKEILSSKKRSKYCFAESDTIGMQMLRRELTTAKVSKPRVGVWYIISLLQLLLLAGGMLSAFITGYDLPVHTWGIVLTVLIFSAASCWFFFEENLNGYRIYFLIGFIFIYAIVLFFIQDAFLSGAVRMGNAILMAMNRRYDSNLQLFSAAGTNGSVTVFILVVSFPLILWIAASVVYRADAILSAALVCPLLCFLFLTGETPSFISLFAVTFGVLGLLASARSVRKKKLWGEKKSERFRTNLFTYQNVQKKTVCIVCLLGFILSIPSFYLVRPLLELHISEVENVVQQVEGKLISVMIDMLPKVSGGKLNLRVNAVGGGVSDGALTDTDGYILDDVEDLRITCSYKPDETIYLKGYIGSGYLGNHWLTPEAARFENAAANWNVEDDAKLYIQNLPFLRKLYVENKTNESQMQELLVERINANAKYTYTPYYSFLNDYYQVNGGDCYISGQEVQDDLFSYYPRKIYQEAVRAWNADEDNRSVLDRLEASYSAYVKGCYLEIPDGYEALREQCRLQDVEYGDVEAASQYIRDLFESSYSYTMNVPALPDGEDFINYFLYETKEGYSTHYASAAVIMFRMFGVPARYVVGYAAPQNLFTAQPGGYYTAVLQSDNAHAWAEVYIEREGWCPMEMTPGALGTIADVEYVGEKVVDDDVVSESSQPMEQAPPKDIEVTAPSGYDLETVIHFFAGIVVFSLISAALLLRIKHILFNLGLGKKYSPAERICNIFSAFYRKLIRKGMPATVESSSEMFLEWVKNKYPTLTEEDYAKMMVLVTESKFGFRERTTEEIRFVRKIYLNFR